MSEIRHRAIKRKKYIYKNLQILFTAIAIVFVWRGIWGLLDHYFFPNNPDISYVFSFLIGIAILFVDDFALEEIDPHAHADHL